MKCYRPFTVTSDKFYQYRKKKLSSDNFQCGSVHSIAQYSENSYVLATDSGLYLFSDDKISLLIDGFANDVSIVKKINGSIFFSSDQELYVLKNAEVSLLKDFGGRITGFDLCENYGYVVTENDFYKTDVFFNEVVLKRGVEGGKGLNLAVNQQNIYVLTETNLSVIHGKRQEWKNIFPANSSLPDCNINTLYFDSLGFLNIGAENGLYVYDNRNFWVSPETNSYLPENEIFDIACDDEGNMYFASDVGVIMRNNGRLKYFSADRYVDSNVVNCVFASADGKYILAGTDNGLSVVERYETTLSEKAAQYELISEKYHQRMGFTAERTVFNYNMDNGKVFISDNDGLWTGYYVASQVFRYTVTGDKEALFRARRGKDAMLLLMKITGIPGFTARAVRYEGEEGYNDGNHEWVKCENEKCEWKCETSSDEMTGHFFALSLYFDLCADESEKEEISKLIRNITEHIISNNYRLCDHDGLPTTWACWDPELLNSDDRWFAERGINSLELLAFLKITFHMSGDEKYNLLYKRFVSFYHYVLNSSKYKIRDAHDCHIDDNLAFLAAFSLLRLENNNAVRQYVLCGLEDHWKYERVERQPLFSMIHAYLTGRGEDVCDCIESLKQMPLDLIFYDEKNSKRKDIEFDPEREIFLLDPQIKYPLPYDERNNYRADAGSFNLDSAGRNKAVDPGLFLLPYWMGRYFGIIGKDN